MVRKDIKGQRFGFATAIEYAGNYRWKCLCDCGKTFVTTTYRLIHGNTKSCGCWYRSGDYRSGRIITHGKANTKLYGIWQAMKQRCSNPKATEFEHYGGRGIKVCTEWENDFATFYEWAMQNGYSEGLTIERTDVNKNYEPSNCCWVSMKEQLNNTRRNHFLLYNGETKTIAQWSEIIGIPYSALSHRIERGWTVERALSTPVQQYVKGVRQYG